MTMHMIRMSKILIWMVQGLIIQFRIGNKDPMLEVIFQVQVLSSLFCDDGPDSFLCGASNS
uniref:Uncharacterized protein n=2 Tax=Picea TaxID=3328 RepID=A0A101LV55_PICGL|nr:hypothetical protein ABT39_MTgene2052 [Picea glauca]QHR92755.1 hypothetical protein Q903MT_gene6803 [Picea sitchensis]